MAAPAKLFGRDPSKELEARQLAVRLLERHLDARRARKRARVGERVGRAQRERVDVRLGPRSKALSANSAECDAGVMPAAASGDCEVLGLSVLRLVAPRRPSASNASASFRGVAPRAT